MKLIIVESPNKVAKIQSFLNEKEWKVIATVGHLRENVTYGKHYLGIDLETMNPQYKNGKGKSIVIDQINKEASKAKEIYLATDPDREGEAISWHVTQIIDNDSPIFHRVAFNEITKEAVIDALENPRELDMNLVHSQEARSALDQMMGFKLSALARKKVQGRSAGRVKSAVMKIIMEREEQIRKFTPEHWFTVEGIINENVTLQNVDSNYKVIEYKEKEEAEKIVSETINDFVFKDRKTKTMSMKKIMPLEMSSALSGLYSMHGYSNSRSTQILQSLYMKGVITYPRTDSKRISSVGFIKSAKTYIMKTFGDETYKGLSFIKKTKSQDAHEAIRPTDINKISNNIKLTPQEQKAYDFIWKTTLKSLMIPGKTLSVKEIFENSNNFFMVQRSLILEPGYRMVDGIVADQEAISETFKSPFTQKNLDIDVIAKSTKPPARYNQSSIIKTMKELGIGRPSTYSSTTKGLLSHGYLEQESGALIPTETGEDVNNMLIQNFKDMIDAEYTAYMENQLDSISDNEIEWKKFLFDFWGEFQPRVENADNSIVKKELKTVGKCPDCGSDLLLRRSRYGSMFAGCSNFPICKHIQNWDEESQQTKEIELPKYTDKFCPNCKSSLIIKIRKRDGAKFLACPRFPKCKHAEDMTNEVKEINISDSYVA